MGEIAEMMLEGVMCEGCGEFLDDGEEAGFPRRCPLCQEAYDAANPHSGDNTKTCCDMCERTFWDSYALMQHKRDKHGITP